MSDAHRLRTPAHHPRRRVARRRTQGHRTHPDRMRLVLAVERERRATSTTFNVRGMPCDETHNAEAVALIAVEQDDYPGQDTLETASADQCFEQVREVVADEAGAYQAYRLTPTESIWTDDNGHRVVCFVAEKGFGEMDSHCRSRSVQGADHRWLWTAGCGWRP